jgi:hypothetical protein
MLCFNEEVPREKLKAECPLAQYCAESWISYAAEAKEEESTLLDVVERFFYAQEALYKMCYSLDRLDDYLTSMSYYEWGAVAGPLYYAAFGGLRKTVHMLLAKNANVNT